MKKRDLKVQRVEPVGSYIKVYLVRVRFMRDDGYHTVKMYFDRTQAESDVKQRMKFALLKYYSCSVFESRVWLR